MITLEKSAFIATSENTQTSTKVQNLIVNFYSQFVNEVDIKQGYISANLKDETGQVVLETTKVNEYFDNKDILYELHLIFLESLNTLNPTIDFTNTL